MTKIFDLKLLFKTNSKSLNRDKNTCQHNISVKKIIQIFLLIVNVKLLIKKLVNNNI